jgi:hypothetical protein
MLLANMQQTNNTTILSERNTTAAWPPTSEAMWETAKIIVQNVHGHGRNFTQSISDKFYANERL